MIAAGCNSQARFDYNSISKEYTKDIGLSTEYFAVNLFAGRMYDVSLASIKIRYGAENKKQFTEKDIFSFSILVSGTEKLINLDSALIKEDGDEISVKVKPQSEEDERLTDHINGTYKIIKRSD